MAINKASKNRYLNTVQAIAASPRVDQFLIGFTSRAGVHRFAEYRPYEYEHLVILADKLNDKEAKGLEEFLQTKCKSDSKTAAGRKYHKRRKKLPYTKGGSSRTPNKPIHSVYMVWWEPY
jgi:hypothetical protein